MNPDVEFALRSTDIATGDSEFGRGTSIFNEKTEDNVLNVEILMLTFFKTVESGYINPFNTLHTWNILSSHITFTSSSMTTFTANLYKFLVKKQFQRKFQKHEIEEIKQLLMGITKILTSYSVIGPNILRTPL